MSDKDDKFSSEFEDDFDQKDHGEHDEFIDHFEEEEEDKKNPTSFIEEEMIDDFDDFDDMEKVEKVEKTDSFDDAEEVETVSNEEEKEDSAQLKGAKALLEYIKSNAIFLVVGGFFIVTGILRLMDIFSGPETTQPVAKTATQNLQFAQDAKKENAKPTAKPAGAPAAPLPPATTAAITAPAVPTPAAAPPVAPTTSSSAPQSTPAQETPTSVSPATATLSASISPTAPVSTPQGAEVTLSKNVQPVATQTSVDKTAKTSAFFPKGKPDISENEFKQMNDKISSLEKQLEELKALEAKLTTNQTTEGTSSELSTLKNQLLQTNKMVVELSNQVRAQQINGGSLVPGQGLDIINESERGIIYPAQAVRDVIVQAVIPGRAWLKDVKGRLVTVQVGDEVPGFGKVVSIDAHRGIVKTSEQYEFRPM